MQTVITVIPAVILDLLNMDIARHIKDLDFEAIPISMPKNLNSQDKIPC